jgi:predicted dehydrogenase
MASMPENRRKFIQHAATLSALSYGRVLGANNRIRIAGIGCGGRGQYLVKKAQAVGGCEIVAASDVYAPRIRETQQFAPEAQAHGEYRKLLERGDVDAVMIGSPDHWHVPMTIDAIQSGKDVYVEKPVSHTVEEGAILLRTAAASKQVIQVGYQQRSWEHFIQARDYIRAGKLGKITLILTHWYQTYLSEPDGRGVNQQELDWKRWLGSAPSRPFDAARFGAWRWYWDYGGGHLTDLFSHWGDTLHWILDLAPPSSTYAAGGRYAFTFQDCPDTINAFWDYPGRFAIVYNGTMHCHLEGGGIDFRGDKGLMRLNRDGFTVYPEGVVPKEITGLPEPAIRARSMFDGALEHVRNFLDCVRSRNAPAAPVTDAVTVANVSHFGNRSYREGRRLEWKG